MIPIGTRHHVEISRDVEVPFRCRFCQFQTTALVRSRGEGERGAPFFQGQAKAVDRASRDAEGDLTAAAEGLAELATCPSCGRFDPVARRIAHGVGLVAPVGLVLAGIAADWFVHSAPLTTALAVAAGAWIYWSTRWRWTESDLRVSFGKPGSGPAGSRA